MANEKKKTPSTSNTAKVKVSGKTGKKAEEEEKSGGEVTYKKAEIKVPSIRYKMPEAYSVSRVGLEVYVTDEDNYKPYVPLMGSSESSDDEEEETDTEDEDKDNKDKDKDKDTSTEEDEEDDVGYKLHLGEILSTSYYGSFESASFESDYKEMKQSASLSIREIDLDKSYKGVRVHLLSNWDTAKGEEFKWEDLQSAELGFITEQTFSDTKMDIKLNGFSKTMDMKYKFDFKQMLRSEIINQVILTAGMKPFINVDGLDDDVTDFSNISSSGGSDSGSSSELAGGEGEDIDSLVASICKGKSDDLEKCKAIHEWLRGNVIYSFYECTKYNTPSECLKNKSHLNCADTARLTRAMMSSAGLNAYVVHGPYHFWTMIEIGGKKYASDQTGRESAGMSGSEFNTVWWQGRGRSSAIPPYDKNGKEPSC